MTVVTIKAVSVAFTIDESVIVPNSEPPTPVIDNFTLSLKCIPCIYYLIWFKKDQVEVKTLLDSDNEFNAMTLTYIAKLGLKV